MLWELVLGLLSAFFAIPGLVLIISTAGSWDTLSLTWGCVGVFLLCVAFYVQYDNIMRIGRAAMDGTNLYVTLSVANGLVCFLWVLFTAWYFKIGGSRSGVAFGILIAIGIAIAAIAFYRMQMAQDRNRMMATITKEGSSTNVLELAETLRIFVAPTDGFAIDEHRWKEFEPAIFGEFLASVLHLSETNDCKYKLLARRLLKQNSYYQSRFLAGLVASRHHCVNGTVSMKYRIERAIEAILQERSEAARDVERRAVLQSGLRACKNIAKTR